MLPPQNRFCYADGAEIQKYRTDLIMFLRSWNLTSLRMMTGWGCWLWDNTSSNHEEQAERMAWWALMLLYELAEEPPISPPPPDDPVLWTQSVTLQSISLVKNLWNDSVSFWE